MIEVGVEDEDRMDQWIEDAESVSHAHDISHNLLTELVKWTVSMMDSVLPPVYARVKGTDSSIMP